MKKVLILCTMLAAVVGLVMADAGTISNAPVKSSAPAALSAPSGLLEHMTYEKALDYVKTMKRYNALKTLDPTYLWLLEQDRANAVTDRGGNLDQGADGCPGTLIAALPYTDSGSTAGLVNDAAGCFGFETAPDVIYQYTALTNNIHHADLCGSGYDTEISIWSGGCLVTMVGCNDDSQCGLQSSIDWCATAGTTYHIVVDGYGANSGSYVLNVSDTGTDCAPPVYGRCCYNSGFNCVDNITQSDCQAFYGSADWLVNETCASVPCVLPPCTPDAYLTAPGVHSGLSTCGAGDNCAIRVSEDLVYEVTLPYSASWHIRLCDETIPFWDSRLLIGSTCCANDIYEIDDGGCGPNNFYLSNAPCLTLGPGLIYVTVEGYSSVECGLVTLTVDECAPPELGRCCYQGACYEGIDIAYCASIGGVPGSVGSTCASEPCPPPPGAGRCCYQGACYEGIDIAYCASIGGVPGSEGSTCASEPCPPPLGRCCYGSPQAPSCVDNITQADCGSIYQGAWVYGIDCSSPCPIIPNALRVISVPVPDPCGVGVSISADCRGDLYYTNYCETNLYQMDAFGALISTSPILDAGGAAHHIDEIGWDEGRQLFWGGEQGTNAIYTLTRTGLATFQFAGQPGIPLTDGCDYDGTDGTIWHTTDVSADIAHFDATGLLLGSLVLLDEGGNPEGTISGVEMGASNTIFAGNSPIDDVRRCNKSTGAFVSRFDAGQVRCEGMECDAINFAPLVALWVKDAYNNTVTAFEIEAGTCVCAQLPDTCQFPYQEIDDGDLPPCNYPTLHANPGHGLSGVAWLGAGITGEPAPNILDLDPADDGVVYVGLPWTPCTAVTVSVTVTAGPVYGLYQECGGHLYLNGWKDGNLDGDFCDELCGPAPLPTASEWIVQDVLVGPGVFGFTFIDPGVFDLGVYDGVFRWRLTSQPVGRYGFGLLVAGACVWNCPATFGLDFLGEVEDYIVRDAQLDVALSNFDAISGDNTITLRWTTASESNNDHFEITRSGSLLHSVPSSGNTSSGHSYEWVDNNVENGRTYSYSLVAVDVNGNREELATEEATPSASAAVITEYALHQNFPNPFNPETQITYDLVEAGNVTLTVYNLMGQEVASLVNGLMTAGRHTLTFNAGTLPSGLYLYKLEVNGFSSQQKMMLMK